MLSHSHRSRRVAALILLVGGLLGLWYGTRARRTPSAPPGEPAAELDTRAELERSNAPVEPEPAPVAARANLAETPARGLFVGRLIDANTGEGVPWFDLELQLGPGERESTSTDADGGFRSRAPLAPGGVQVRFGDDEGSTSGSGSGRTFLQVQHDGTETPARVWIHIGPTYFVTTELPPGRRHDEFHARLFRDPPLFDDDSLENDAPKTRLRAPRGGNPLAWVRFREPTQRGLAPLWLELQSDDGLWRGGARVPGEEGVLREPVALELRATCTVVGRARVKGSEEPAGTPLALFREGDPAPRWGGTRGEGEFEFGGLEPGEYRLEVRDFYRAEPRTFRLTSGELDLGELLCTPIPVAGRVRLRVRSAVELPLDVELVRRTDAPRHAPWHSDSWEELPEGGFESAFEWDEVYAGRYEVVVHSHALGTLHLSLGELEPPVEDLLLELPAPPPELQLSVVDAESGRPLADWTLLVRSEHGWEVLDGAPATLALSAWDEDACFAVCSPGYRAWVARPGDGRWPERTDARVVARLERGWSRLFLVNRRSRREGLAGVELLLDGRPAGTTDARGELWVHAERRPETLAVVHPELVLADENGLAGDGWLAWLSLRP